MELAKAAVLYADHVDLISTQAGALQQLSSMQGTGLAAVTGLITDLDDDTLEHLGMDTTALTPEIRAMLPMLMSAMEMPQIRNMLPTRGPGGLLLIAGALAAVSGAVDGN